jgi:hypothetical protein
MIGRALGFVLLSSFCSLCLPGPPSAPTFSRDIAPILYRHCAECHWPNGIGPMPLLDYQQVRPWAAAIGEQVLMRKMPPWKPEPGYGNFAGARVLDAAEIETIRKWLSAGAPEGERTLLPPPPHFGDGWQLGEPDLILTMPEPFEIPVKGSDIFQCFVLPIDIPAERRVRAFEFQPGNRRVLHHSILFLDRTGAARKLDAAAPGHGYASFGGPGFFPTGALGGWSPGSGAVIYPEGASKTIRPHEDLVLHSHYHPSGRPEQDRSRVGIYFASSAATRADITVPVVQHRLLIPAGHPRYTVTTFLVLPVALEVASISPHMHYLGREMKVWATLPDGRREPLISIKDWDVGWQGVYRYAQPVRLPAGTRIELQAVFDNSLNNPNNPSKPPRVVKWGDNSTDEMALCLLEAVIDNHADLVQLQNAILDQPGLSTDSEIR